MTTSACSSTIDGAGDGDKRHAFDIAVGAEVTLTFENGAGRTCDQPGSSAGCLTERPRKLDSVTLGGAAGSFTIVSSSLDPTGNKVIVTVKAQSVGSSVLLIDYGVFGQDAAHSEFVLNAREITHVDEKVGCQWPDPPSPSHRYPVSQGSTFGVTLVPMADAIPLLSGAMDLITDRGGLDPVTTAPDGRRTIKAPGSPPRSYEWKLVGGGPNSHPLTFDVYDPATIAIDVVAPPSEAPQKNVAVRPSVNATPTCVYEGDARAMVRVIDPPQSSSCRLLLGDFEVEGDLPVLLNKGGASLEVGATGGACTIEATLKGGSAATDRVTLDNVTNVPAPVTPPPGGKPLGTTMVETGGTLDKRKDCPRVSKISNGKCEAINAAGYAIPDGDCFTDLEWKFEHHDGTGDATKGRMEGGTAGVGLLTELRLYIEFSVLLVNVKKFTPNALSIGQPAPPEIEVQRMGCETSSTTDYEAVGLRLTTAGTFGLRFKADNGPGELPYAIGARDIARASFLDAKDAVDVRVVGDVASNQFFIGSLVPITMSYFDSGNGPLRGVAPVRATSSDGEAKATIDDDGDRVFSGSKPQKITLTSPVAKQHHVIDVVDVSAVTEIAGLGAQDVKTTLDESCVEPFPKGNGGQRILGKSPQRTRVSFGGGDACAVRGDTTPYSSAAKQNKLCVVAGAGAPTDVKLSLGSATSSWACKL